MGYIGSNIVPIVAATLVGLVVGAIFLRLDRTLKRSASGWQFGVAAAALSVAAEFWLAAILAGALILAPATQAGPWTMALGSAVIIWIGFVLPTQIVSGLARRDGAVAITTDCLHWLIVMLLQATVLQAIGLVHP